MALSLEQYRDTSDHGKTLIRILTKRLDAVTFAPLERQRRRSLQFTSKNRNQIPEHLIIEILSHLPVKTLLQFKSVCKSWYAMIKSSHFISKHLRNYYDNNNNWRNCLIVQYSITQAGELNVYELLMDDTKNRVLSYQLIETPVYNTYLCGPCDGIYYLWCICTSGPRRSLWNPALNEFKILPDITWTPNIPQESAFIHESYGFGYDSKTNDYKVILILSYSDTRGDDNSRATDNPMSILIYSLRTNSWRYWGDMDNSYVLERNRSYVFVNGCCYWLSSSFIDYGWRYEMIISFDIGADTCHEIPLPEFATRPAYGSQLIVFQDLIAFAFVSEYDSRNFFIWTWDEEAWTQKFRMKLDSRICGAISVWRDGMLVLGQGMYKKVVLCDPNTRQIFVLDDSQAGNCANICAYKENLFSIYDFGKDIKRKGRRTS